MKLLSNNEGNLMRLDAFTAVIMSLLATMLILMPIFTSAKGNSTDSVCNNKIAIRYITCTRASIAFENETDDRCIVSIKTSDNEVLYSECVKKAGKSVRVFEFLNLEDGTYTVSAKSKTNTVERNFTIKDGELIRGGYAVVDPIFRCYGTRAMIELPNIKGKEISLKVVNSNGDELYSAVEENDLMKNLEFSKLNGGNYQVLIAYDGDDYAFDFKKENK